MKTTFNPSGRMLNGHHPVRVTNGYHRKDNLNRFLEDYFIRKPNTWQENREAEDELTTLLSHTINHPKSTSLKPRS